MIKKDAINYYGNHRPDVAVHVPPTTKTILDIGCGNGAFLKWIKDKTGAETWGIELVDEIAERAKEQADNILNGKVEEVLHLVPDGYFDCITFNDVLEHLLAPDEVLRMVKPKLSEKGIIIASIPNVRYFSNLHEIIIKKDWEYKDSGILDSTHFRFFTQKSMKKMFEKTGYSLKGQFGINKLNSWKFKILNLFTLGFINDTKYLQFICIAIAIKEK